MPTTNRPSVCVGDHNGPICAAEYKAQIMDSMPKEFASTLPNIELLEAELGCG